MNSHQRLHKIDRLADQQETYLILFMNYKRKTSVLNSSRNRSTFQLRLESSCLPMMGAIAEFERDLINERTKEGRERAKAQGKHLGRKGQDTTKTVVFTDQA
ncbi:recombinase family protein [Neobacillus drentensis]